MDKELLSKLQKIKALMESPGTEAEAEAAAAALQRFLTRHQLDATDLDRSVDPPTYIRQDVTPGDDAWERLLIQVLARHNFCRFVYYTGSPTGYLIGRPEDIQSVSSLYTELRATINRFASTRWRGAALGSKKKSWKRTYSLGAAHGMDQAIAEAKATVIRDLANSHALVLVRDHELQVAYEALRGNVSTRPRTRTRSYAPGAYSQGYQDGRQHGGIIKEEITR